MMKYSFLEDVDVAGERDWYYYSKGVDQPWNVIVKAWIGDCQEKYFKYVKNRDVMISGGAHIGMYCRFFAKEFKTVYAFEPEPFHFFCLVNNVRETNVVKIQAALGNEHKMISLTPIHNNHLNFTVIEDDVGFIPMLRIDDLNLSKCDLIQLDIENYEFEALKGAQKTIESFKPVIIAENGHVDPIKDFLMPMGYNIKDRTQWDTIWTVD